MKKLTEHQNEIYERIVDDISNNLFTVLKNNNIENRLLSLMGAAGTGKSFLTVQITKEVIRRMLELDYYSNDPLCITAPTNKAVKVLRDMLSYHDVEEVDCRTLQSFLNIKPVSNYETGEEKYMAINNQQVLARASLLIVDESSMVSKELYEFILDAVKMGRVNTVLFIGDSYQLLPVNGHETEIFKLHKQYKLTQIVRQAEDSDIIQLASTIRECIEKRKFDNLDILHEYDCGQEIELFRDKELFLQDYYSEKDWDKESRIMTSYTNEEVDNLNALIRSQYWKEKGVMNPDAFLPTDKIRFKSPLTVDRVSRLNNPILFSNGEEVTINKVQFVSYDKSKLKFWKCSVVGRDEKDYFRVLDPNSLPVFNGILEYYADLARSVGYPNNIKYWKDYFQLKGAFADVQYIFASTIHKLQGSTYETVYIDLTSLTNNNTVYESGDLQYRLAYVAVTRARKRVKILY